LLLSGNIKIYTMNYDTERALSRKVDDWQLHALQSKVDSLEHTLRELKHDLEGAQNTLRNHYSAMEKLIQLLIDRNLFSEDLNLLYEIKQYL
jgi:hypothetical protein